ncbi:MAG: hypothetical protein K2N52_00815, partial [Clostridia bacterium]|nr:hypothetical protein [Clostridia bacterium]
MITENGTVKVRTVIDENSQKEFSARLKIFYLLALIAGSIGFCIFLTLYILSVFFPVFDNFTILLLMVLFAVDVGLGIVIKIQYNRALQTARTSNKAIEYEFFADYFTLNEIKNGETVTTAKFYNSQITKVKNGKNYYFI